MADGATLDFDEAAAIVAELAEACALRTGALPRTVVMVGGTALAARAVRTHSYDVDVYFDRLDDDAVAEVSARYARRYGPSFKIDATPSETIWGVIAIRDIAASPPVARVETRFGSVEIRALTVETSYVVEAAADRDKDRSDLVSLARYTDYPRVLDRARTVFPWYGDRAAFPEFVERLGRRMSEHFAVPLAIVDRDLAPSASVAEKVAEIRRARESQYWPVIKELMRAAPVHLSFDALAPERVSFDARAAGAPDVVLEVLRNHPGRAEVLAAEMLGIVDPVRNRSRLMALRRARDSRDLST